jgi:hypothetical protein
MIQFMLQSGFMLLVAAFVIGFVVASSYALRRWRGGWRWIAGLPLLGVLAVGIMIIVDVSADPTAHNLWPFEILGAVVIAGVALAGIQLMRLITRAFAPGTR